MQQLISKSDNLSQKDRTEFKNMAHIFGQMMERLMIQQMTESMWFSKPIIQLPPNTHEDIRCLLPGGLRERLQQQEKEALQQMQDKYARNLAIWQQMHCGQKPMLSALNYFAHSHKNRIYAIFPALLDLEDAADNWFKLTLEELRENRKTREANPNINILPYLHDVSNLVERSFKCCAIKTIQSQMGTDHQG